MATREEYIEKLEAKLKEWNAQIDALQEKADQESEDLTARFNNRLSKLKEKRSQLTETLDKIKDSGENTFSNVKKDAEQLWEDLKEGVEDARSILKGES